MGLNGDLNSHFLAIPFSCRCLPCLEIQFQTLFLHLRGYFVTNTKTLVIEFQKILKLKGAKDRGYTTVFYCDILELLVYVYIRLLKCVLRLQLILKYNDSF